MDRMFADSLLDGEHNASGGSTRDWGEEVIRFALVDADIGSTVHGDISVPPSRAERNNCSVVTDLTNDIHVLDGGINGDYELRVAEMERGLSDGAGCTAPSKVSLRAHAREKEGHTPN